jgi:hypothetical protein
MIVEYRTELYTTKVMESSFCYTGSSKHSLTMELKNSQYLYLNKYLHCGLLLQDSQLIFRENI